jgi:hypothetical protein
MANRNILTRVILVTAGVAAVIWRLVNYQYGLLPNSELITSVALGIALLTQSRFGILVPFALVAFTDLFIGIGPITTFTWSAWLITGGVATVIRKSKRPVVGASLLGGLTSITFYLWTNFGVWLLSAGRWYSFDTRGIVESYIAGLPFLRTMLILNLVLPAALVLVMKECDGRDLSGSGQFLKSFQRSSYSLGDGAVARYNFRRPIALRHIVDRVLVVQPLASAVLLFKSRTGRAGIQS